jgi:hypothetical protein
MGDTGPNITLPPDQNLGRRTFLFRTRRPWWGEFGGYRIPPPPCVNEKFPTDRPAS